MMPTLIVVGTLVLAAVTASAVQFAKERSVILPVFLLAVVTPLAAGSVDDRSWPRLPCAGDPFPSYADVDAPPRTRARVGSFGETAWLPPACVGWGARKFKVLVALAGRFRDSADASSLLARFGAISRIRAVLYWSVTDDRWRHLTIDADALQHPDDGHVRADFTPDELRARTISYFRQKDNRLRTTTVYGIHVRDFSDDRIVVAIENVSAMRFLGFTVVEPGGLQSLYFLEREGRDVWRYYALTRTSKSSRLLFTASAASYINRAVAMYRYIAGIPTDRYPPAATGRHNR